MGNSASALPYSIGAEVVKLRDGWVLHEGSRKNDGASVSVFQANKPTLLKTPFDPRQSQYPQAPVAALHYQQSKKLRHPHILQVYATLDTDNPTDDANANAASSSKQTGDWIIVTEPCIPLQTWLNEKNPKPHELAWGVECMIKAVSFLHNSANLAHGNISPDSFFVTLGGDVKLWNFGLVTTTESGTSRHFRDYEGLVCPNAYRSPERREARWDAVSSCAIHVMDSYSMGILVGHLYHDAIPAQLQKAVQRLQTANIRARPRLAPLLKCPVFETPYRQVQQTMEEFTVQPVEAKVAFWQSLPNMLQNGVLEDSVATHKVLPLMKLSIQTICTNESMLSQDMYRREVLAVLPPLFFIAETYLAKESDFFSRELSPIVTRLFAVNDRGVRGALLARTHLFVSHMDNHQLNSAVFEPMCSGFSDSSAALRELTLKATISLVPHLTAPNLEKLSRYLVRLQADPETSIRTNTVIFICKLAPHLTEMNRQKMLLPAYTRAMKDGFEPCRLAALQSLRKSQEFYDAQGIATRVLPAVMPQLLDPAANVRKEAFAVVESCMVVLKEEDKRLVAIEAAAPPPVQVPATSNVAAQSPAQQQGVPAAPSSGSYLSGLSSWMASSAKPTDSPALQAAAQTGPAVQAAAPPRQPPPQYRQPAAAPVSSMSSLSLNQNNAAVSATIDDDFGDGWDDDDDDGGLGDLSATPPTVAKSLVNPAPSLFSNNNKDDDDFFSSFDSKPTKPAAFKSSGGKLKMPKKPATQLRKPPKPDVTKLAVDDTDWDDF